MKTRECIKWLWKASRGVRSRVLACSITGGLHVAASLVFVWVSKRLIDAVTIGEGEPLTWYIVIMVGCMLMQTILSALETRMMNHADVILKNRLRHSMFSSLMESRWDGKESFHTGDSVNRMMEDVRVVGESVTKSVPAVLVSAVQFIAAFFFLFALNKDLAWVIPGLMLAMLLISRSYIRRMRKLTRDIRETESSMQSLMQESLQHRVVIHTLEKTPYVTDNLSGQQEGLRGQVMDRTDYSVFARSMVQIGFTAGYVAAFLWGVFGIRSGAATFGMMTAFLQLVGQIQRPVMILSRQFPPLINSLTSAERLSEACSLPSEEKGESVQLASGAGVRFEDVTFSYPDSEAPVLSGFSCEFTAGVSTALVGETGAGKSTMMRLMLALLSPQKGKVMMYSGDKETEVSPQTRCNIVYVPQGNTLMSGTIRENLLLGDPQASDDDLRRVLHVAAADFVEELPAGMDTMCGEKGSGLSEGQAQRICIARSLLRKGGILLLDEPTAALDPQTEEILLKRIFERAAGQAIIIVTHREAAVSMCKNTVRI